jgi:hypothetical protein
MDQLTSPEDAKARQIAVPPALVEAVQNDPEVLAKLSRAQLMMVQDKLTRQYLESPDALISHGTAVAEALRKTANLDPKEARSGIAGASVVFNFNVSKPPAAIDVTKEGITIDAD